MYTSIQTCDIPSRTGPPPRFGAPYYVITCITLHMSLPPPGVQHATRVYLTTGDYVSQTDETGWDVTPHTPAEQNKYAAHPVHPVLTLYVPMYMH